jgi:2-polyprenyl-3-methyl-5-hydroxy-6-metoxy-1,4-benzoquinol methylase
MAKDKHVYEYEVDLSSDTAPARVLRMVRPGSRVLEIGAGPGSITRHLSGTLGCSTVALEVDPSAIDILRNHGIKVHPLDLNDQGWSAFIRAEEGLFDHVIAADVLEHVYNPWSVLDGMTSLLAPGGTVILSLPHVGHAAVAACLLDEDFDYRPWGLLDRTHIRFFGVKNVQSLINGAGLAIERAEFVVRTPAMTEFVARWNRMPETVQSALQKNRYSHVLQVVTSSRRADTADTGLDLMCLRPEPPSAEAEQYWTTVMAAQAEPASVDRRSTFAAAPPGQTLPMPVSETPPALAVAPRDAGPFGGVGDKVRLVAYYLPQFHPFPENDEWWGKGFTEWTNVTKAAPLFVGHYQPHLPADLGFYDLRLDEVRRSQIAMAKAHGIDAFCYHYYWFSGKRLMEGPLDAMLGDPASDMPFCLCWANENWTRRWDGRDEEVLIAQKYAPTDPLDSIKSLEPYLRDPRYIEHDGKKVIVVYRPQKLPDSAAWMAEWREYARTAGLGELHLVSALTHGNWTYRANGFDGGVEFPPHNITGQQVNRVFSGLGFHDHFAGIPVDYRDVAEFYLDRDRSAESDVFRCVYPSWDNTARRHADALVTLNATPANYEYWLHRAIVETRREFPDRERLLFINAWNEWAEGCHLEPDRKYGHAFLESTLRARQGSDLRDWTDTGMPDECNAEAQAEAARRSSRFAPRPPAKKKTLARSAVHGIRDVLRVVKGKR